MRVKVMTAWLVALALFVALATPAVASTFPARVGTWTLRNWTSVSSGHADQGLALVDTTHGPRLLTRGSASVPDTMSDAGWIHIGDPSSAHGYVLDAYQGTAGSRTKLFMLTAPNGKRTRWIHRLVPGEAYNNSFTALSPDGRWFVSGEWGTMTRLLVFRTPSVAPSTQATLDLAGTISLDHAVRNVQGCAFADSQQLLCSTNDPRTDLFPVARQLLRVQLTGTAGDPAKGSPAGSAHVTLVGAVPAPPGCAAAPEVEGIDVHGDSMTVASVAASQCGHRTYLFEFARDRDVVPSHGGDGGRPADEGRRDRHTTRSDRADDGPQSRIFFESGRDLSGLDAAEAPEPVEQRASGAGVSVRRR